MVSSKLVDWVTERLADLTPAGAVARLELWHSSVAGDAGGERIAIASEPTNEDPSVLAERLWDEAEHDASTRSSGSVQRYVVLAFRSDEEVEADCQHGFVLRGGAVGHPLAGDTDPPTEKGALAVALRSMVESNRLVSEMADVTAMQLARRLSESERRREAAENRALDMMSLYQELLDRKQARELAAAREAVSAKRSERVLDMAVAFAPLLLAQYVSGKGQLGLAAHARDTAIGAFMKTLTEDEFRGIVSSLSPEKAHFFVEAYKLARERAERENAEKPGPLRDEVSAAE